MVDLRGLWRVVVVIYVAACAFIACALALALVDGWPCPTLTGWWVRCPDVPTLAVLYALAVMAGTGAALFGGGLVVRWIYRGFVAPQPARE